MWQIQWMISLIPDEYLLWIINTILTLGIVTTIAGFFIKFIPFVNTYRLPVQILGVLLLTVSVYFKGGYGIEMAWREKVKEAEAKVAKAEAESADLNQALDKERKKKTKVIKEYAVTVKERIVEKEKLINADCRVNPEAISILNDASKNPLGGKK